VGEAEAFTLSVEEAVDRPEENDSSSKSRAAKGVADTLGVAEDGKAMLEDQLPHWRAIKEVEATTLEVGVATEDEGYQSLRSRAMRGVADTLGVAEDGRAMLEDQPPHWRATSDVEETALKVEVATEEEGYQASKSRATRGVADTGQELEDGAKLRAYRNGSPAALRPRRKKEEESMGGIKEPPRGGAW
jgi:hypothetical protein